MKSNLLTGSRKIMLGFLCIILVGALLLMLPVSTRDGQSTTFLGALFCSVSATCVTGLVAYDTFSHWSLFGQLVLLTEIQIGGLGFITISTFMMIVLRRRIGIGRRALLQDSLSMLQVRGSVRLVRRIVLGTLLFEGVGAILLSLRFVPQMGLAKGIYYGIFHSISAFCNAGFDLMGFREPYSSFCAYAGDPLVILTLSALIIIGGIGFIVWEDLVTHRFHWNRYRLHTKLVLISTAVLLVGGTALFWILENHALFAGMTLSEKFLAAFFSAVTPRTAGFNSVDTAALSNGSLFLTIIFMFIGGSPGSTAGGIKTITVLVILLHLKSYIFHDKDCSIFGGRLEADAVKKATVVVCLNLFLAILGMMIIFSVQTLPFTEVMFEVFSAIGTAGMSTGVTRQLSAVSKVVIMILMYFGRMGSLTFAMSFTERKKPVKVRYPEESIVIG
ncbi:MAG: TrkH family potassium uptake protein [Eubacteriales bacterium]|nr:TrkH family potassium uptake protein [Eubacteriales bacterium]